MPFQVTVSTQDGVNLQDRNTGSIQSRPPGLDTIEEFRVETAVSSAKLTRPASAIMTTRSGTNLVHGSLFDTGRNSGFGVARQRQDTFTKAPHLVRNEFGASFGGPVFLPKVYNGKNKTFFFGSWEELRQRQASTTTSAVWTEAMRVGDFNGLIDNQNRRITLYDPWSVGAGPTYTKTPYVGNQLPLARLSPIAKYMFGVSPLPTNNLSPLVGSNLTALAPANQNQRTLTFRGDHRLSQKDLVFGRYSHGSWDLLQRRSFSTGGYVYGSPAIWRDLVLVGSYSRRFYALDAATGLVRWSFDAGGPISGSASVVAGVAYVSTLAERTFALDARTGRELWSFPDGKYCAGVADSTHFYLVGYDRLFALTPRR